MQTTSTDQLSLPADFLLDTSLSSVFSDSTSFSLTSPFYGSFDSNSLLSDFPLSDSSDNDSLSSVQSPLPLTPSPLELSSHMYLPLPTPTEPPTTISTTISTTIPPPVVEVKIRGSKRKNSKESPAAADVAVPQTFYGDLIHQKVLKDKRLARKAELARQSRKKKKALLVDLEQQVAELQAELSKAREEAKHLAAKNALLAAQTTKAAQCEKKATEKAVEELLSLATNEQNQQSEGALNQLLNQLALAFQNQSASMEMNVQSLEQSIVPCLPLQFLDWTMMQKDKFFEEESSLFLSLFRDEMGASPQQLQQLLVLRRAIQLQQTAKVKDQTLMESLKNFKKVLAERGRLRQAESFEQLRSIFTPKQMAAYLKWVNRYGHVLVKVPVP